MEDDELQNRENWDWDTAETRHPVKQPRAVVSVAFNREDFERLSTYARSLGTTVSAVIRQAALEKLDMTYINTQLRLTVYQQNTGTLAFSGSLPDVTIVSSDPRLTSPAYTR